MRKIVSLFIVGLFALVAAAQQRPVLRVLAIGNSFSEDAVEHYLWELGQEAGIDFVIGNAYRGGWSLAAHWKDASTRAANTDYRKVVNGRRTNMGKRTIKDIVTDEPWDVITLQQVSQEAGREESYEPSLSLMIGYVKALATNDSVRLGFHQTWAYAQDSSHGGFANYDRNQFLMYASIVAAVEEAMQNHRGDLQFYIPVGTAIQNARTTELADPVIGDAQPVNRELTRDGFHLNYTIGRYIAACTWFEALTGISSVGLKSRPKGVTPVQAELAQRAAHAAIEVPVAVTP